MKRWLNSSIPSWFCDRVVVRRLPVAESKGVVVASLGDEAAVKRLYIRDEIIAPRPGIPDHGPIPHGPDDGHRVPRKIVAVRRQM